MEPDHLPTTPIVNSLPVPITTFRDTLQPSFHRLQPLSSPLLPTPLLKLATNAYIELRSSKTDHEVPYNDEIVSFLKELVPQAELGFLMCPYPFKLAKADTMGLRDVHVLRGVEYAQTRAVREYKDWVERGRGIRLEVSAFQLGR